MTSPNVGRPIFSQNVLLIDMLRVHERWDLDTYFIQFQCNDVDVEDDALSGCYTK